MAESTLCPPGAGYTYNTRYRNLKRQHPVHCDDNNNKQTDNKHCEEQAAGKQQNSKNKKIKNEKEEKPRRVELSWVESRNLLFGAELQELRKSRLLNVFFS